MWIKNNALCTTKMRCCRETRLIEQMAAIITVYQEKTYVEYVCMPSTELVIIIT